MAYSLIKIGDVYNYTLYEFFCDEEGDVSSLPNSKSKDPARAGSIAIVANGKRYVLNNQDEWVEITSGAGGSGSTGAKGDKGVSMRLKGAWQDGTQYVNDGQYIDVVTKDGNTYGCIKSHTSATSSIEPSNSTYWIVLAQKGDKGDKGETGAAGADGAKGEKGDPGAGLTGESASLTKIGTPDSAEAQEIATKVNEIIDQLIARGISKA